MALRVPCWPRISVLNQVSTIDLVSNIFVRNLRGKTILKMKKNENRCNTWVASGSSLPRFVDERKYHVPLTIFGDMDLKSNAIESSRSSASKWFCDFFSRNKFPSSYGRTKFKNANLTSEITIFLLSFVNKMLSKCCAEIMFAFLTEILLSILLTNDCGNVGFPFPNFAFLNFDRP